MVKAFIRASKTIQTLLIQVNAQKKIINYLTLFDSQELPDPHGFVLDSIL